jgi:dATP pyrophosphohydrolase
MLIPFTYNADGRLSVAVRPSAFETSRWAFPLGGGEANESPLATARRIGQDQGGLDDLCEYSYLSSIATIPVEDAGGFLWGNDILVVPEYCFAVEVRDQSLSSAQMAQTYRWLPYEQARTLLVCDRQRNALWELRQRLVRQQKNEVHS